MNKKRFVTKHAHLSLNQLEVVAKFTFTNKMEGIASLGSGNPMTNNSFLKSIFEMGIADYYYSKILNIRFLKCLAT